MNTYMSGFKALSDLTRLRALRMILISGGPLCVCEISEALGLPQYRVSKHLAILRQAGLVTDSRVGTWVYYSVPQDLSEFTGGLCDLVREHLSGPVFEDDAQRLKARLELREDGRCVLGPNRPTRPETEPRDSSE
ncbi:MAG: ArsR/SmtB family transcription factor [Bacillota bacterium]|jgi:ArsR family transcriptional regulator